MRTRPGRFSRGFTLIEVVVAFVLLGLVLSTGYEVFSEGLARAGALEERSRALDALSRPRIIARPQPQPEQERAA